MLVDEARSLLAAYPETMLPTDFTVLGPGAKSSDGVVETTGVDIAPSWHGMDIGPATSVAFSSEIARAGTVLWNGPIGHLRRPPLQRSHQCNRRCRRVLQRFTVAGGGDAVAALHSSDSRITSATSRAGADAPLELLEYGDLPGIAALRASASASDEAAHAQRPRLPLSGDAGAVGERLVDRLVPSTIARTEHCCATRARAHVRRHLAALHDLLGHTVPSTPGLRPK